MIVRDALNEDALAVRQLVTDAFGQLAEADLVEALRRSGDAVIDLVAELDSEVVGHVLLSKLQSPARCVALAPVSVTPKHQKKGVGSALIRAALGQARAGGLWVAVSRTGLISKYANCGPKTRHAA